MVDAIMKTFGLYHAGMVGERFISALLIDPVRCRARVRHLRRQYRLASIDAQKAIAALGVQRALDGSHVSPGQLAEMLNNPDTLSATHQRIYCAPQMAEEWRAVFEAVMAGRSSPPRVKGTRAEDPIPTIPAPMASSAARESANRRTIDDPEDTESEAVGSAASQSMMGASLEEARRALKEKDASLEEARRSLEEKVYSLQEAQRALKEKDASLEEKRRALEEKDASLKEKIYSLQEAQEARRALEEKVNSLKSSNPLLGKLVAAVLVVAATIAMLQAERNSTQAAAAKAEANRLRSQLQHMIDESGLRNWLSLSDPRAFQVSKSDNDHVVVKGTINTNHIMEVRVSWGDGVVETLYKYESPLRPTKNPTEFTGVHKFRLNNEPVDATLEFRPFPDRLRDLPEYFPPKSLRRTRTFLLAKGGIKADPKPVALEAPTDGSKVAAGADVEGRLNIPGAWPVVLVKALTGGDNERWWVQPLVEDVVDGAFAVHCAFGDDNTKPGTKFRIVVVVAKSKEAAARFVAGTTRPILPVDMVHSQPVDVIRDERH